MGLRERVQRGRGPKSIFLTPPSTGAFRGRGTGSKALRSDDTLDGVEIPTLFARYHTQQREQMKMKYQPPRKFDQGKDFL